ncbi:MAG: WbqC family protein [Bacteroidia bacterium]|nr:WbqC family protein [Bacteroidia bacterium]
MSTKTTVLSMAYLPNIEWMHAFLSNNCIIDIYENFQKQSYRNRAVILSANGTFPLVIPIQNQHKKTPMHALQPDNQVKWQRQHWESIKAAYGSSAFYIHYAPYFEKLYHKPALSVLQFEVELLQLLLKLLKIDRPINLSTEYIDATENYIDLRQTISPKVISSFEPKPYLQIFAGKFPFQSNLSVLDLLFNQGTQSISYIL